MQNFNLKNSRFAQNVIKKLGNLNGTISVKRGRPVINMLLNMSNILGWRGNASLVKVIVVFASRCNLIRKQQSIKGLSLQLKIATVLLQQSMGGYKVPNVTLLGQRQSRNGQGLPRKWIPAIHRAHLRRGDAKFFKLWMTLFGIYRVLDFPGKLNLSSITACNGKDFSFLLGEYSSFICGPFRKWIVTIVTDRTLIMMKGLLGDQLGAAKKLVVTPFIISSSSPSVRKTKDVEAIPLSTSPAGILQSVKVWYRRENDQLRDALFSFAKMTSNIWMINRMESWSKKIPKDLFLDTEPGTLGKVACLEEAAGKIRVVALVDCWTQWIMHPLFSAISKLLSRIPMDGTINQRGPYDRLWERKPDGPFYCYDLSSATDRLPIVFQQALLSAFFGSWFATLWGQLLVGRPYRYVDKDDSGNTIVDDLYYQVGQPMGAKSSFHMMALFHHTVIQWAAFRRGRCDWFQDYAIVGDDVVIADQEIASEYLIIMEQLGVSVGLHKSLVSSRPKGLSNHGLCSEFIKKTYYSKRRGTPPVDVSALPISRWYMGTKVLSSGIDLAKDLSLSLSQYLTMLGFGYRVKGNLATKLSLMSRRCRHKVLSYFSPRGVQPMSFSLWISMKSIGSKYKFTHRKIISLFTNIMTSDIKSILEIIRGDSFSILLSEVKRLTTINRDREFYGTVNRKSNRIHVFQDLVTYQNDLKPGYTRWVELSDDGELEYHNQFVTDVQLNRQAKNTNDVQHMLDELVELVYRPAYLDVIINVRDIVNACEELLESLESENPEKDVQVLLSSLDTIHSRITDLSTLLSGLPFPKEIYKKVESEITVIDSKLIKSWERYATVLRSTRS